MRVRFARLFSAALFSLALFSCGGGGGGGAAAPLPLVVAAPSAQPVSTASQVSVPDFQNVASALARSQRPDGAIPYTATNVNPYFANIAATGAARTGTNFATVRQWIAWYALRSRDANPWGLPGAITDYTILTNGTLRTTGTADSVDAYAATFLTLVSTAWQFGDAATRTYVQSLRADVERIASAIDAVTDADGLTWALPSYRTKYLMDATEVYAGLNDLAVLRSGAYGDVAGAVTASQRAASLRAAIAGTFWSDVRGTFAVAVDANGTVTLPAPANWSDAMAQLAPILHGVISPSSSVAAGIYSRFNAAFPGWTALSKPDEYPWASVAYVALQMNDAVRAGAYRNAVNATYALFSYPWYCAESGWYMRVIDGLISPATITSA